MWNRTSVHRLQQLREENNVSNECAIAHAEKVFPGSRNCQKIQESINLPQEDTGILVSSITVVNNLGSCVLHLQNEPCAAGFEF